MIKVATIAVSSLFVNHQISTHEGAVESRKVELEQKAGVMCQSLQSKADLPSVVLEFCESFDPDSFSQRAGGSVGCYAFTEE